MPLSPATRRLLLVLPSAFALAASSTALAQSFVLEEATIASAHAAMRKGELTCRGLTEAYLARIQAYDDAGPSLNAILTTASDALEQADAMDRTMASAPADVGSLHCVPVILKDNYNTADMPTTGSSSSLEGMQPSEDAFSVARMREAGALILAKSNLQEFAMGGNTVSSLGGQTLNPYDLGRTPGGSSGGTGAAIAANFGMIGTGSDTGQSIRSPASAQSLVGIRPTRGLVSRSGVMPVSFTQDEIGPITRTVEDAARMLDVIAGYDPADPITAAGVGHKPDSYLAHLDPNALAGAKIGLLTDFMGSETVHEETNARTREAADLMRTMGAEVVEFTISDFSRLTSGLGTGAYETEVAMDAYLATIGEGAPLRTLAAIRDSGKFDPAIADSMNGAVDNEMRLADPKYLAIFQKRDELQKAVLAAMAEHGLDAVLYPHQKRLVVPIGDEQVERNGVLSNSTGFPAITFPGGFSTPSEAAPVGVPIGIELLGRPFAEAELIGYVHAFEKGAALREPPQSTPAL